MKGLACTAPGADAPIVLLTHEAMPILRDAGKDAWALVGLGVVGGQATAQELAAALDLSTQQTAPALMRLQEMGLLDLEEESYRWPGTAQVPLRAKTRRKREPLSSEVQAFVNDALAAALAYPEMASLNKGPYFRLAITRIAKKLEADGESLDAWSRTWAEMLADPQWRGRAVTKPSVMYTFQAAQATRRRPATSQSGERRQWGGWA